MAIHSRLFDYMNTASDIFGIAYLRYMLIAIVATTVCVDRTAAAQEATESERTWRVSDAPTRLLVAAPVAKPHQLHVPIPREWRSKAKAAVAYLVSGQQLATKDIHRGKTLTSVEVNIPQWLFSKTENHQKDRRAYRKHSLPIEVYLLTEQNTDQVTSRPIPENQHTPIALHWKKKKLLARPYESDGIISLMPERKKIPFQRDVKDFKLAVDDWDNFLKKNQRKNVVYVRWSTHISIGEDAEDIRFGGDVLSTPWFLFVDGKCMAQWSSPAHEIKQKEGGSTEWNGRRISLGPKQSLSAGTHRLDLVSLVRHKEQLPRPLWQKKDHDPAYLPQKNLHALHYPAALKLTAKGTDQGPGLSLKNRSGILFPLVKKRIFSFVPEQLQGATEQEKNATSLSINGSSHDFGTRFFFNGHERPDVRVRTKGDNLPDTSLTLPSRFIWHSIDDKALIRVQIQNLPVTVSERDAFNIRYRLKEMPISTRTSDAEGRLPPLHINLTRYDSNGKSLKTTNVYSEENRLSHTQSLTLTADNAISTFGLQCKTADTAVSPIKNIRLTRAEDARHVTAKGQRLLNEQKNTVLCVPRLAHLREDPPLYRVQTPARSDQEHLLIVDEYVTVQTPPHATLPLAERLRQQLGHEVTVLPVSASMQSSCASELRKFHMLDSVLDQDASYICWTVGSAELHEEITLEEWRRHLVFLVLATFEEGSLPILVTPPIFPDISEDRIQKAAYMIKRLGRFLDVPVVDLYSQTKSGSSHRSLDKQRFFYNGAVHRPSLNKQGQRLFEGILRRVLKTTETDRLFLPGGD